MILFDDSSWRTLRPLTLTRPVGCLRVGILTIGEKWARRLGEAVSYKTRPSLAELFPALPGASRLWVNGSVCPTDELTAAVSGLRGGEALLAGEVPVALREREGAPLESWEGVPAGFARRTYSGAVTRIEYPYQLFACNGAEIARDFELLTAGRPSAPLGDGVQVRGNFPVFAEEGAMLRDCLINTADGPVYLGRGAEIMEGSLVRGPAALCDYAALRMGARVYGATTLGPFCKCGGELDNVVFAGFSSKAHEGFLGHSVVGEWCNVGAGTSVSNLKNSYGEVKLWDYARARFRATGLQFCGLIMGDHSKLGINMMINTGTVVGVSANLYGSGFPRNFIPSFAWGGAAGFQRQSFSCFAEIARAAMARRDMPLEDAQSRLLAFLYEHPDGE